MAFMMVQQFVSFMVDAGYDGPDVTGEGDYGEVDPVKKASDTDCLLKAAMVAGFQPNICVLYRGQRSPWLGKRIKEMSLLLVCLLMFILIFIFYYYIVKLL